MLKSKSVYLCHENNLHENILHEISFMFRLKAAYIKEKKSWVEVLKHHQYFIVQILTFFFQYKP